MVVLASRDEETDDDTAADGTPIDDTPTDGTATDDTTTDIDYVLKFISERKMVPWNHLLRILLSGSFYLPI